MFVVLFFALTWKAASQSPGRKWPTHEEFETERRRLKQILHARHYGRKTWEIR
jgi:hypothetical protein